MILVPIKRARYLRESTCGRSLTLETGQRKGQVKVALSTNASEGDQTDLDLRTGLAMR